MHLNVKEHKCAGERTGWIEQNSKKNYVNKSLPVDC